MLCVCARVAGGGVYRYRRQEAQRQEFGEEEEEQGGDQLEVRAAITSASKGVLAQYWETWTLGAT